jgi:flagellar motor switch/type III secretory pathway protein FliN
MSSSPSSLFNSEAPEAPPAAPQSPIRWLLDVPCSVDVVLGTATVKVRDCAQFALDSVISLKQTAGSDLEVRVGGVPMFTGEVVIMGENVALRLGRVLPPAGQELV